MEQDGQEQAWFVYAKGPMRFSAMPINVRGWLALLVCGTAIAMCSRFLIGLAAPSDPMLGFVILFGTVATGVVLVCRLIVAKGRPVA